MFQFNARYWTPHLGHSRIWTWRSKKEPRKKGGIEAKSIENTKSQNIKKRQEQLRRQIVSSDPRQLRYRKRNWAGINLKKEHFIEFKKMVLPPHDTYSVSPGCALWGKQASLGGIDVAWLFFPVFFILVFWCWTNIHIDWLLSQPVSCGSIKVIFKHFIVSQLRFVGFAINANEVIEGQMDCTIVCIISTQQGLKRLKLSLYQQLTVTSYVRWLPAVTIS